ncbi:hypoxia induced protein conserved region-domain-containing protein [Catenaria anguillulae PL171]|uniref:Hypoxia induced protein conserved region-domain-containing protein n=1 Tax=Catenaria anguillulae PL171 TaxID=765915 RepID=A0A1Y2HDS3_9FUNG|nr:hypoxia induced protein conserved region-domain-containing protein [Catenaria anguillulae PL171]
MDGRNQAATDPSLSVSYRNFDSGSATFYPPSFVKFTRDSRATLRRPNPFEISSIIRIHSTDKFIQVININMPYHAPETFWQKVKRKSIEEPLVPIGMTATVFALLKGVSAFRAGDQKTSQQMMRWRIAGQGFTLAAALAGLWMYRDKYQQSRIDRLNERTAPRKSGDADDD